MLWDKVSKNRPSKIYGRQPLKIWRNLVCFKQTILLQIFWRLSSTNFTWSILEYFDPYTHKSQAHSEPCQTSEVERKNFFAKRSILDVWHGSEYVSESVIRIIYNVTGWVLKLDIFHWKEEKHPLDDLLLVRFWLIVYFLLSTAASNEHKLLKFQRSFFHAGKLSLQ